MIHSTDLIDDLKSSALVASLFDTVEEIVGDSQHTARPRSDSRTAGLDATAVLQIGSAVALQFRLALGSTASDEARRDLVIAVNDESASLRRSSPEALGNDMAACNAYGGAHDAARGVRCPVTFVLGGDDKMTPVRAAGDLIDAVADQTVVVLDGSGHMMPIEDPIRVRRAIADAIGWDGTR